MRRSQVWGKTSHQLGHLDRANLSYWIEFQFPKRRVSSSGRWTKPKTPVILSVIHHRQNPLESTNMQP
jgi:hypothetical protein